MMLKIIAELGTFIFLTRHYFRGHFTVFSEKRTQPRQQIGILRKALHQDVFSAIQHGLRIAVALLDINKGLRLGFRYPCWVGKQHVGQRLDTRFARQHALGHTTWLIGQVQIFQTRLGVRIQQLTLELRRELALLLNAFKDGIAAILHLAQVSQTLL